MVPWEIPIPTAATRFQVPPLPKSTTDALQRNVYYSQWFGNTDLFLLLCTGLPVGVSRGIRSLKQTLVIYTDL